jgi:diguanylate cyclase (GGDEF)-like protein/PAS domain S-box-containing protein
MTDSGFHGGVNLRQGSCIAPLLDEDGNRVDRDDVDDAREAVIYRTAAETAGIGTWNLDPATQVVVICRVMSRILGLPPKQHQRLASEWEQDIHPDDLPAVRKALNVSITSKQPFSIEHRVRRIDGRVIWLLSRGRFVENGNGTQPGVIGACLDVTDRKIAEEAARASEERYHQLAESSPDGILVKTGDRLVWANAAAARIFGTSCAADLIGRSMADFFDVTTDDILQRAIARALDSERVGAPVTLAARRLDGAETFVELGAARISWEGRPAAQVLIRDVTEQKRLQDDMALMHERLKFAVEGTGEGIWDWDLVNNTFTFSGKLKQIFGWDPDEPIDGKVDWSQFIHPDDLPRVTATLQAYVRGETPLYETEYRQATKQDGWKWVLTRGVVVARNERGKPVTIVGTTSDITARKETEELAWRHAHMDTLTGLPNRRLLRDWLEAEIRKAQRSHEALALLFVDLDGFKQVNDLFGHEAGDLLLSDVARRLKACVRDSDIVARFGGDEFTVVLTGLSEASHIEFVCEKILVALARPFALGNEKGYVTGSIGVALSPIDADSADELMRKADQAMYAAKQEGKNRFSYFTREMDERAHARLHLSYELRHAVEKKQLSLSYQPIIDLRSGMIAEIEALVRWTHPVLGNIAPSLFVPIAEECGLINAIGNWVFQEAAVCSRRSSEHAKKLIPVGINKSPSQFVRQDENSDWLHYLEHMDIPPNSIVVEITEGLLLHPSENVNKILIQYADSGMRLAIDDFGTGYSSMSYLHKFHIDYLKIDQSFVHDIETNPSHRTIAETIIIMAHRLGLQVIAEGIETRLQMEILAQAGCDYGQGYYFSRPVSEAKLLEMLPKQFIH